MPKSARPFTVFAVTATVAAFAVAIATNDHPAPASDPMPAVSTWDDANPADIDRSAARPPLMGEVR